MHIETSYPRRQGDKARLTSPSYAPVNGGQCFQFWYHMYGSDINTLNIFIKTGSSIGIPVWSRSGDRGNVWKIAQVPVTTTSNFKVCATETFRLFCLDVNGFLCFCEADRMIQLSNKESSKYMLTSLV